MNKFDVLAPLDEYIIKNILDDGAELNFTAKAWNFKKDLMQGFSYKSYDTHTPLTYCISQGNKFLFKKLIEKGADINYPIDKWGWLPLTYALKTKESFFLEELLNNKSMDIYKKIDGKNIFNHVISLHSLTPDIIENLKKFLEYIKKINDFDYEKFFNTNIFIDCSQDFIQEFLLSNLEKSWLKKMLNATPEDEHFKPHIALYLLDMFYDNPSQIKNIINLISPNEIIEDKNTLLHYYLLNNYRSHTDDKHIKSKYIILEMLKAGFSWKNTNLQGYCPYDYLKDKDFFNEFLIQENHKKIEKKLSQKPIGKIQKI